MAIVAAGAHGGGVAHVANEPLPAIFDVLSLSDIYSDEAETFEEQHTLKTCDMKSYLPDNTYGRSVAIVQTVLPSSR